MSDGRRSITPIGTAYTRDGKWLYSWFADGSVIRQPVVTPPHGVAHGWMQLVEPPVCYSAVTFGPYTADKGNVKPLDMGAIEEGVETGLLNYVSHCNENIEPLTVYATQLGMMRWASLARGW